jgi:hypothetical protein
MNYPGQLPGADDLPIGCQRKDSLPIQCAFRRETAVQAMVSRNGRAMAGDSSYPGSGSLEQFHFGDDSSQG